MFALHTIRIDADSTDSQDLGRGTGVEADLTAWQLTGMKMVAQ